MTTRASCIALRLNGLGSGRSALQEALVVIAADIDQRGGVVRSLMAVQVRDISGDLVREIDRQGMPGGDDQNRRRCVAGFRSSERAIVKSHVQHFGQLFSAGGTPPRPAAPAGRSGRTNCHCPTDCLRKRPAWSYVTHATWHAPSY